MSIRVALHHRTQYSYDRLTELGPQVVRLRPAPHCRTPIRAYSLKISPSGHYLNWQQDPYGNYLARLVFNEQVSEFVVEVDVQSEMTVINPFDFFLEPTAEMFPFSYTPTLLKDLMPFLHVSPVMDDSPLAQFMRTIDRTPRKTIDFLVELNTKLKDAIGYVIRMEPGVQTCDETLAKRTGSCRDSGWLLVNILRHMGFAARFVSGYLIQLTADVKSLDGPSGPEKDFTDLHAWAEVYLPGAGWIGLDPTSGLLAGEGHIPLACTPEPISAAPISGTTSDSKCEFLVEMTVARIHEDPRVTLPYSDDQWRAISDFGHKVDEHLAAGDVRLTMGGEPTFVSIDDMESDEWRTAAVGPHKRRLAGDLLMRLKHRWAPGGLLHLGQGKWYPGEQLPRWALRSYWRLDGEPMWRDESLFADPLERGPHTADDARNFGRELAARLGVNPDFVTLGYEDVLYYTWKERRLPTNVDVHDAKLEDKQERERMARVFEQGITAPVGCMLPLRKLWWLADPCWESGSWVVRSEEMFLTPGDSAMGFRLPLQSLKWHSGAKTELIGYAMDPVEARLPLPEHDRLREELFSRSAAWAHKRQPVLVGSGSSEGGGRHGGEGPFEGVGSLQGVGSLPGGQWQVARSVCRSAGILITAERRSLESGPHGAVH